MFKAGECNVLICTDVASRGLDIPSVDMVINYDIPTNSKVRLAIYFLGLTIFVAFLFHLKPNIVMTALHSFYQYDPEMFVIKLISGSGRQLVREDFITSQ